MLIRAEPESYSLDMIEIGPDSFKKSSAPPPFVASVMVVSLFHAPALIVLTQRRFRKHQNGRDRHHRYKHCYS